VALNNLAWLLAQQGKKQTEEALALINRALDHHGAAASLLDTRAVIYLKAGKSDLALQDLLDATAWEPTAPMFFHLAQAHWLVQQRQEAEEALARARAAKLTPYHLHRLERAAYQKILKELATP
jgi:predicted Zn-dependent protease